jgi:hypothetical protein
LTLGNRISVRAKELSSTLGRRDPPVRVDRRVVHGGAGQRERGQRRRDNGDPDDDLGRIPAHYP